MAADSTTAHLGSATQSTIRGGPGSSGGLARVRHLIAFASRLSPLRIKIVKAGMVATVWLVGLLFLDAGWFAPMFAVAATLAWLAGARWIQHFGAAALVLAVLVRIGAVPPPVDWRALIPGLHAPPPSGNR